MIDVDEMIDTSDLDLLDDGDAHARCTYCQPQVAAFQPFFALCGVRAVYRNPDADPLAMPVNACGECASAWHVPCARCGAL